MQNVKKRVTRRTEQAQPRTERPDHWTCQHGGLLLMTLASMMPVEWGVEVRLEWVQGWRRGSMGCRHPLGAQQWGGGGRRGGVKPWLTVLVQSKPREKGPRQGAQVLGARGPAGIG